MYGGPGSFSSSVFAPESEAKDVIEMAKKDLEKLKKKEKKKKKRYSTGVAFIILYLLTFLQF